MSTFSSSYPHLSPHSPQLSQILTATTLFIPLYLSSLDENYVYFFPLTHLVVSSKPSTAVAHPWALGCTSSMRRPECLWFTWPVSSSDSIILNLTDSPNKIYLFEVPGQSWAPSLSDNLTMASNGNFPSLYSSVHSFGWMRCHLPS